MDNTDFITQMIEFWEGIQIFKNWIAVLGGTVTIIVTLSFITNIFSSSLKVFRFWRFFVRFSSYDYQFNGLAFVDRVAETVIFLARFGLVTLSLFSLTISSLSLAGADVAGLVKYSNMIGIQIGDFTVKSIPGLVLAIVSLLLVYGDVKTSVKRKPLKPAGRVVRQVRRVFTVAFCLITMKLAYDEPHMTLHHLEEWPLVMLAAAAAALIMVIWLRWALEAENMFRFRFATLALIPLLLLTLVAAGQTYTLVEGANSVGFKFWAGVSCLFFFLAIAPDGRLVETETAEAKIEKPVVRAPQVKVVRQAQLPATEPNLRTVQHVTHQRPPQG